MTDILTPAKGLTQQTVGGNDNTWGGVLNTTLGLIDSALGVSLNLTLTGSVTLTSTQLQNSGFFFNGTLAATATVTFPNYFGLAVVHNGTNKTVLCKITSVLISIPAGVTMPLWSNGTDFTKVGTSLPVRMPLSTTLNLYVNNSTGSDSNDGLTSTTAFQTLQRVVNVALNNYDTQGNSIVANVANGTYTVGAQMVQPLLGGGTLQFLGNTGSPASCVVNLAAAGPCFLAQDNARMQVSGFTLSATHGNAGNPGYCLGTSLGGLIIADHIVFGAAQYAHITSGSAGYIQMTTAYTISGGAGYHMVAGSCGGQIVAVNLTSPSVILTGTPAFTSFLSADAGAINVAGTTWSGSATGLKLFLADGGVIFAGGAQTSLPGVSNAGVQINQGGFIS